MRLPSRFADRRRGAPFARPRRADREGRRRSPGWGARDHEGAGDQSLLRSPPHAARGRRGGRRAARRAARGAERASKGAGMISGDITVARLLDEHPELVEVLAGYHPHFERLRNRLLRRVMAPRVTVAQAARMAGVPEDDLLAVLRHAVGEPAPAPHPAAPLSAAPHPAAPHPALSPEGRGKYGTPRDEGGTPRALADVPATHRVHLDVREDIRR